MKTYHQFATQIIVSALLLILAISPTRLYAQEKNEEQGTKTSDVNTSEPQTEERKPIIPPYKERKAPPESGITFWNLLRWVVSLTVVIGLIYAVMYLLKKGFIQKQRPAGTQGSFNILGQMPIGPKRMLYLIEVANRVLVLGVTEAGINTLSEITDQETVQTLKKEALMYETDSRFARYLKKATSKVKG